MIGAARKSAIPLLCSFFFNDTATTEIYTLSLHDALPICLVVGFSYPRARDLWGLRSDTGTDRKSTRLNSSHSQISYAAFCLKNKHTKRRRSSRATAAAPAAPAAGAGAG